MSIYHQMDWAAARRYLKQFCNELWISDIKYGFPVHGKMTYLIVFMDDASRFIVHASLYPNQEQSAVESAFRDAVSKFGVPNSILFDNGVQYRTRAMARICAKLVTRLIYCRPYSPEAKGCVVFRRDGSTD